MNMSSGEYNTTFLWRTESKLRYTLIITHKIKRKIN